MAQLFLIIAIVLLSAKLMGALTVRFGFPSVLGEILAGVLLSSSCFNLFGWPILGGEGALPTAAIEEVLRVLAELGVLFLMFIAGLETDMVKMRKVGNSAFWAAAGGVILPLVTGALIGHWAGYGWHVSVFIGTLLTATSVSITAQTLLELGQLQSKEGTTTLGAAVIDDVMGVLVLSIVVAFVLNPVGEGASAIGTVLTVLGMMTFFFVISILVGRVTFEPFLKLVSKIPSTQITLAAAVVICLVYSWSAELVGKVAAITGAYIAGVLFGQTSFRHELIERTQVFAYSFFVPIFLADVGLRTHVQSLGNSVPFTVALVILAIVTKIIGCGIGSLATGFSPLESLRVGVGMISRGEVGLIIASYGLSHGVIDEKIFAEMVLVVLITTLVTPIGLRVVFPGKKITKAI